MDPVTLGLVIAVVNSLLGFLKQSGDTAAQIESVRVLARQCLENQAALAQLMRQMQATLDQLLEDVGGLPSKIVSTLYAADAHKQSNLLRDTLLSIVTEDRTLAPQFWDRAKLEIDGVRAAAEGLKVATAASTDPSLVNASAAIIATCDAAYRIALEQQAELAPYVKTVFADVLRDIDEVLTSVMYENGIPDRIRRCRAAIDQVTTEISSLPLKWDRLPLYGSPPFAEPEDISTVESSLVILDMQAHDLKELKHGQVPDYGESGFAGPPKEWWVVRCSHEIVDIPCTVTTTTVTQFEALVTVRIDRSADWRRSQWTFDEYRSNYSDTKVIREDDRHAIDGLPVIRTALPNLELEFQKANAALARRNALVIWLGLYEGCLELAVQYLKAVRNRSEQLR